MRRPCEACGREYEAKTMRSRYCSSTCRARVSRGQVLPVQAPEVEGDVSSSVRAWLAERGEADSARGLLARSLAARVDAGTDPAAGLAALYRELLAALAEIDRAAGPGADTPLAQIQRRRAARQDQRATS